MMARAFRYLWISFLLIAAICLGYLSYASWPGTNSLTVGTTAMPPKTPLPAASPDLKGEPYRVAVVTPFTGKLRPIGQAILDAARLAAAELNAESGVSGRPVEIVPVDGKCDRDSARKALAEAFSAGPIDAIVGGTCSDETLGIADIANSHRIVAIAPSGSDDRISKAGPFVFRLVPSDSAVNAAREAFDRSNEDGGMLRPYFDERTAAAGVFFRDYRRYFDRDPLPPWYLANAYSATLAIARLAESGKSPKSWPDALTEEGLAPVGALPATAFDRNGDPIWKEFVISKTADGMTKDTGLYETK